MLLYLQDILSEKLRHSAAVQTGRPVRGTSGDRLALTTNADQPRSVADQLWSVRVWRRSSRQDSAVGVTWRRVVVMATTLAAESGD